MQVSSFNGPSKSPFYNISQSEDQQSKIESADSLGEAEITEQQNELAKAQEALRKAIEQIELLNAELAAMRNQYTVLNDSAQKSTEELKQLRAFIQSHQISAPSSPIWCSSSFVKPSDQLSEEDKRCGMIVIGAIFEIMNLFDDVFEEMEEYSVKEYSIKLQEANEISSLNTLLSG
ncbi:MAG: hypothetical protein ACHQUC_10125, partial [Chlamydiales bacterium]